MPSNSTTADDDDDDRRGMRATSGDVCADFSFLVGLPPRLRLAFCCC